jgi:hypothetical protein
MQDRKPDHGYTAWYAFVAACTKKSKSQKRLCLSATYRILLFRGENPIGCRHTLTPLHHGPIAHAPRRRPPQGKGVLRETTPFRFVLDAPVRCLCSHVAASCWYYGFVHPRLFDFFVDTTLVPIDVSSSLKASKREYPELQRQNVCKIEKRTASALSKSLPYL